eukprot:TRINITY_DN10396_c0_g2_i5.p2 TRINITY_DN10396_c0_g2~~TRINITY_DN10396_c0_g2_i5.p2  ORF type:complete len:103 (+),score=52.17 TRINITY_DN10396_c0_g2_i5:67-375(+)
MKEMEGSARTLECGDTFHAKCVDNWMADLPECPKCEWDLSFTGMYEAHDEELRRAVKELVEEDMILADLEKFVRFYKNNKKVIRKEDRLEELIKLKHQIFSK